MIMGIAIQDTVCVEFELLDKKGSKPLDKPLITLTNVTIIHYIFLPASSSRMQISNDSRLEFGMKAG